MNPLHQISVAQYGIGPIGAEIGAAAPHQSRGSSSWLPVDIDPKKIGKTFGEVIGLGREVGVKVTPEVEGKPQWCVTPQAPRLREVRVATERIAGARMPRRLHLRRALLPDRQSDPRGSAAGPAAATTSRSSAPASIRLRDDKLPLTLHLGLPDIKSVDIIRHPERIDAPRAAAGGKSAPE